MDSEIKYPIGEQSFEVLRTNGFLYVDKSRFIETLLNSSRYYFLGRPRRFGKSLFLSMLKCFFEGKRHLFRGLYADGMDWDWCEYPVLYLDINIEKYKTPETLGQVLLNNLLRWEETYGITPQIDNLSIRFNNVIRTAYMKTGRQVVVLVDEYDKPLVNNLHDDAQFAMFRDMLASFYSNFKTCADYLKLVFLTGVSRFGKLSVFSDLNNIRDISFDNKFSDICGITETELIENLGAGIKGLSETYGTDERQTIKNLRRNYDGYRFSANGKDIYNPFSILCAMERAEFGNYWIQSGQPTLLLEQLKKYNTDLATLFPAACDFDELSELDIYSRNPVPLLYQTGYLTIKSYDLSSRIAHLDIPNLEVKKGFLNFLLPYYADLQGESSSFFVSRFVKDLKEGNAEGFMNRVKSMFASIPYDMEMDNERNIHNALLMLMILIGTEVRTEYRTSDGRIDLLIRTDRYYYIIELKKDGSALEALEQINAKNYELPFAIDKRKIIKIGADFSSKTRTLSSWIIEPGGISKDPLGEGHDLYVE